MYIVFEGIDLVGKSSQIDLLKNNFPYFIFTREPGGTDFGEKIREIILHNNFFLNSVSEFFLFLSDRSEHYQKIVKPNNQNGKVVVSDRSIISGMAYAMQNGGIPELDILNLNLLTIENKLPDLTIFIKISKDELIKRRTSKSHDNIELRGIEYALQVQDFLEYWIDKLKVDVLKIDASQNINDIEKIIKERVSKNII